MSKEIPKTSFPIKKPENENEEETVIRGAKYKKGEIKIKPNEVQLQEKPSQNNGINFVISKFL